MGPVKPKFSIGLNVRDDETLKRLKDHFGIGSISNTKSNNGTLWTVNGNNDIEMLIKFFNTHRLRSKKQRDFLIWRRIPKYFLHDPKRLMWQKVLKELRPRPFRTVTPLSYQWLLGFIEGEGGFLAQFRKKELKTKEDRRIECTFQIVQKEKAILEKIAKFIGGGTVRISDKKAGKYMYYLPTTELDKLTSLLKEDDFISARKRLDYENWKKIKALVVSKKHLTDEGYAEAKLLHSQMHKYDEHADINEELTDTDGEENPES